MSSSVYIDLTESVSQSDSDSLSELSDNDPGTRNDEIENDSDQLCASDCCVVISDGEDKRYDQQCINLGYG
jgi:hypothetical protein